jgi:hypothetical protein
MPRARQEDNLELARYRSGQVMAGFSQEADMICSVGNDSGKGVAWWVVPIALAIAAALAWAVTYLEQTGRIKLN